MNNPTNTTARIRDAAQTKFNFKPKLGYLFDASGVLGTLEMLALGYVYVRGLSSDGPSIASMVRCAYKFPFPPAPNQVVNIGYDTDGQPFVESVNFPATLGGGGTPVIPPTPIAGPYLNQMQLTTLRVVQYTNQPSLKVMTNDWIAYKAGVFYNYPGQPDFDLTSLVPADATTHCIILIGLQSDFLTLEAFASTAIPLNDPLGIADVNEATALLTSGSTPIWSFAVTGGATQILDTDTFLDLRQLVNTVTDEGGGTVTSVGLSLPSIFTVTVSPITSTGALTAVLATQTANTVFAGPTSGGAATPTFRALVAADIPSGGGSPLIAKGDVYTFSSVNARIGIGADNTVFVADSSQTTGNKWSATLSGLTLVTPTIASFVNAPHNHQNAAGGGTLDATAVFAATILPVANGGTAAATLTAHAFIVGNGTSSVNFLSPSTNRNVAISSGTDWTSRALVSADIPALAYVTSVGLSLPAEFTVTVSPITSSGTLTAVWANESANKVFAGPTTGSPATPTFRALVAADIPSGGGSPLTTKGDVYTFSTVNARLGIGADNTVFVADSAQTTGNKWTSALTGLAITSSTVDSTIIGGTTAAAATFTAVSIAGAISQVALGITSAITNASGIIVSPTITTNVDGTAIFSVNSTMKLSADLTTLYGMTFIQTISDNSGTSHNLTVARSFVTQLTTTAGYTGTVTFGIAFTIADASKLGGTIVEQVGLLVNDLTSGSVNVAIQTGKGVVTHGDSVSITGWQDVTQLAVTGNATQTSAVFTVKNSTPALLINLTGAGVLTSTARDAGTNTVLNVLTVSHDSSGSIAANYGTGVALQGQDTTTADTNMARWRVFYTTATHASYATQVMVSAYDSTGERDVLALFADGSRGYASVLAGTQTTTRASLGGSMFDHFADAGNTTTAETDLYSDSLPGSTLATNGDKIEAEYAGIFVTSATASRRIRVYFGGTLIFDSTAITSAVIDTWYAKVTVIRVSSSTVRCTVLYADHNTTITSSFATTVYTSVGSLTLTNAQIIKITGTAAGTGAATNDIVAKLGNVKWMSAA